MARLMRLDFRQIGRPGEGVPSLEDIVAKADLEGFLHDANRARLGRALGSEHRRAALMRRQLDAVDCRCLDSPAFLTRPRRYQNS